MALSEFDLIARYFQRSGLTAGPADTAIELGIGDDGALLAVPPGHSLALTMDLLVADVHFPADAEPAAIASKALAVNLSDLAAMGAAPVGFTLGLAMPEAGHDWLQGFSDGLRGMARGHGCPLIGGDITRSPVLSIAIQAHGLVASGRALRRSGARPGDLLYVSGTPGDGGAGLELVIGKLDRAGLDSAHITWLEDAYFRPAPRLGLGRRLVGLASAAIDISDGLLADLGHIAHASRVGLVVRAGDVPLSAAARAALGDDDALRKALGAGDDYELAFTVPPASASRVDAVAEETGVACTRIGEVVAGEGVRCLDREGRVMEVDERGYIHF